MSTPRRFRLASHDGAHVVGLAADAAPERVVGIADDAELGGDDDAVAPALDGLADQDLVGVRAVDVGGVEQRDAEIEGAMDRGDAFGLVGRAVELGHAHAAEAEGGHGEWAEMTGVHGGNQSIQVNGPRGIRAASNAGSAWCRSAGPSVAVASGVTPEPGQHDPPDVAGRPAELPQIADRRGVMRLR